MSAVLETDASLVKGAQARALLSAYLENHPGEHAVGEVSEATGLSRGSAGQYLRHMAQEKLIKHRSQGTKKFYSARIDNGGMQMTMGEETKTRKKLKGKSRDVELVLNGTLIVLGRNPATGRLRITLEEV